MSNVPFAAQMEELAAYMASKISVPTIGIGGGYAPIGTINFFDATTAPQDWLACDGSVHNIADYPQLAEYYATQHGAANFYGGNGTTTFAVPNLQGEFLRGAGTNGHTGQGGGSNVGVHQDATQIPNLHISADGSTLVIACKDTTSGKAISGTDATYDVSTSARKLSPTNMTLSKAEGQKFATRPTNTAFLICVKAVVAGEVYSTEERVVGTWVDGKKIYQKVVRIVNTVVGNNGTIPHGITNIDTLVSFRSMYKDGNSVDGNQYCYAEAKLHPTTPDDATKAGNFFINSEYIICNGSTKWDASENRLWHFIFQYTKTTDA